MQFSAKILSIKVQSQIFVQSMTKQNFHIDNYNISIKGSVRIECSSCRVLIKGEGCLVQGRQQGMEGAAAIRSFDYSVKTFCGIKRRLGWDDLTQDSPFLLQNQFFLCSGRFKRALETRPLLIQISFISMRFLAKIWPNNSLTPQTQALTSLPRLRTLALPLL